MAKLVPFPIRRVKQSAASVLTLSELYATSNVDWKNRPVPPEQLGNMLQRLARTRPAAVLVLENLVAELLAHLDAIESPPAGPPAKQLRMLKIDPAVRSDSGKR